MKWPSLGGQKEMSEEDDVPIVKIEGNLVKVYEGSSYQGALGNVSNPKDADAGGDVIAVVDGNLVKIFDASSLGYRGALGNVSNPTGVQVSGDEIVVEDGNLSKRFGSNMSYLGAV